MNWAMDSAWKLSMRRACTIPGLLMIASLAGCARMNSFSRGEPPMLGRTSTPASNGRMASAARWPGCRGSQLDAGTERLDE